MNVFLRKRSRMFPILLVTFNEIILVVGKQVLAKVLDMTQAVVMLHTL